MKEQRDRSNTTYEPVASNPGGVDANLLLWAWYYPKWPSLIMLGIVGSFLLAVYVSRLFLILFFIILAVAYIYRYGVHSIFVNGCVNPAVVVSVKPLLIAVYTDLSKGFGDYPGIKILKIRLPRIGGKRPEIGMRLATIAYYAPGPDNARPYWVDFDPFPVECVTWHSEVNLRVLKSIPDEEWEQLTTLLPQVRTPKRPGIYRMFTLSKPHSGDDNEQEAVR